MAKNWRLSRLILRMILLRTPIWRFGILARASKKLSEADRFIGIYDEDKGYRGCIIENLAAKNYGIPSYLVNVSYVAPDIIEQKRRDARIANLEIY